MEGGKTAKDADNKDAAKQWPTTMISFQISFYGCKLID
jgi:hypothetical protein